MNPVDDNKRAQAWSSYWAGGSLHSCAGSFSGNYSGAIAAFWSDVSAAMAPAQRVVDLATGNGAIPLLLWNQAGTAARLQIDAVDLASVAPAWYRPGQHDGIRFHSGVRIEHLPFATGSVDWLVSQYGIEYADRAQAVAECLRVAAPTASFAFVMHHSDSVLAAVALAELGHQNLLLAEDGLLVRAASVLPWVARARAGIALNGNAVALGSREAYNRCMSEIADAIATSTAPDLLIEIRDRLHALLLTVSEADLHAALAEVSGLSEALKAARVRTQELIACALSAVEVAAFIQAFTAARPHLQVFCEPLRQSEGVLGWGVWLRPALPVA